MKKYLQLLSLSISLFFIACSAPIIEPIHVEATRLFEDANEGTNDPVNDDLSCPKNKQEVFEYIDDKTNHGMPYGFPMIKKSESFFNKTDAKHQMTSRYIYEHYYLGHINFDTSPNEFYKLVRSKTPYPKPIEPSFLIEEAENLSMPIETNNYGILKTFSDDYRNKYSKYFIAKHKLYDKKYPNAQRLKIFKSWYPKDSDGKSKIYTIVINRWHDNVNSLLGEESTLNPNKDTMDLIKGSSGSYPNVFVEVDYKDIKEFKADPVQAGLYDLNRYFRRGWQ